MVDLFAKESLLDEIGIIRYALENTKTFSDIEFDNYNDDYPLHLALLSKASGKVIDQKKNNQEKKLTICKLYQSLWSNKRNRKHSCLC